MRSMRGRRRAQVGATEAFKALEVSPSVRPLNGRGMRGVALMCCLGLMLALNHFLFGGKGG